MAGVTFSSSMVTATSADMDNRCISWLRLEEDLDVVEFLSSLASLAMLSLQSGHVCLIFSQGSTQFLWNSWLEEEVAEVNLADLKKYLTYTEVVHRVLQTTPVESMPPTCTCTPYSMLLVCASMV